nr:NAD(P)H-binding protein [Lentilactobacillus sp. SPB1-3]MCZ0977728.1 NAD(P)H-binding protein [Lentilactobacillus sp. SPB1-3]
MKKVILIGANGATMKVLEDQLKDNSDVHLTLFLRNASRINTDNFTVPVSVFEGDATNQNDLNKAIAGQDIVAVGLSGVLSPFVEPIKQAMNMNNVHRLIFILGLEFTTKFLENLVNGMQLWMACPTSNMQPN